MNQQTQRNICMDVIRIEVNIVHFISGSISLFSFVAQVRLIHKPG